MSETTPPAWRVTAYELHEDRPNRRSPVRVEFVRAVSGREGWVMTRVGQVYDPSRGDWKEINHDLGQHWSVQPEAWMFDTAEAAEASYRVYRGARAQRQFGPIKGDGTTELHMMAVKPDPDGIRQWAAEGGPTDPRTDNQDTPLHFAAWQKQAECMKALLELGADPNASNYKQQTPFHHVVNQGFVEGIRLLHEAGARWDARDNEDRTPFELFCQPRSTALRRSRTIDPDLASTLVELMPNEAFLAFDVDRPGAGIWTVMGEVHSPAFAEQLRSALSRKVLETELGGAAKTSKAPKKRI